jgi:hypothetical protein
MKKLKYPSTAMVRDKLGAGSKIAKRIYALEKWAVSHGYDGYKAINRKTRADKLQQTELGI